MSRVGTITLEGDVARHEGSYRARVNGVAIHAYGSTVEEVTQGALEGAKLKLNLWYMQGAFIDRLVEHSIQFTLDSSDEPPPHETVRMELLPA